jgi:NADH-quinone oxidoreductase subunit A
MTTLVLFILIFIAAGLTLLAANLVLGWFVRPDKPSAEKAEVYECGEQPVGPAWVQFDLRFYVVALLFVIFDVELAFFFPWAVVFGSATRAADESQPAAVRVEAAANLQPQGGEPIGAPDPAAAQKLAWLAFADIMVFFGVLLVGFAYLWRRGDLEWVRSTAGQEGVSVGVSVSENHTAQPPPPVPATTAGLYLSFTHTHTRTHTCERSEQWGFSKARCATVSSRPTWSTRSTGRASRACGR